MKQVFSHRRLTEPEDAFELQPHYRVGDLTERPKRQSVAHGIFDDRLIPIVVEPVGVLPEPVGAMHLFVNESARWLPT